MNMHTLTKDTFFNGHIQVKQYKSGYRFSIDAVLLSHSVLPNSGDVIVDLGTGCGIIPLIVAFKQPNVKIFGIEIQSELAEIASLNIRDNHLDNSVSIICMDMKKINQEITSGPVDMVICNPPYRKFNSGRINPLLQKAIARHEIMTTIEDIIIITRSILRTAGKFVIIYPAERISDLINSMRISHIEPKLIRMIHSNMESCAKIILVEGVKEGRPGTIIGPPLIIYKKDGTYTDEVENMFCCNNLSLF